MGLKIGCFSLKHGWVTTCIVFLIIVTNSARSLGHPEITALVAKELACYNETQSAHEGQCSEIDSCYTFQFGENLDLIYLSHRGYL